jgi:hypothetical protein
MSAGFRIDGRPNTRQLLKAHLKVALISCWTRIIFWWFAFNIVNLVQARSKFTTFKCDPRWVKILHSLTSDSIAAAFIWELAILTATVFYSCTAVFDPILTLCGEPASDLDSQMTPKTFRSWKILRRLRSISKRVVCIWFINSLGSVCLIRLNSFDDRSKSGPPGLGWRHP